MLGAQAVLAWYCADLLTGLYHRIVDRGDPRWPFIGRQVLEFKSHHLWPTAIVDRPYVGLWLPVIASAPVFLLGMLTSSAFLVVLSVGTGCCQQVHRWAHSPDRPGWVDWLQRLGLILPPSEHERHHADVEFNKAYAVLNGWSNPLLDRIFRMGGGQ